MNEGPIALGKNDNDISDFNAAGGISFNIAAGKLAAGLIPKNAAIVLLMEEFSRSQQQSVWGVLLKGRC